MKKVLLATAFLCTAATFSYAQGQAPVVDTHPNATLYIYDPQSAQEVLAETDDAILFKDALVQLVANTAEARSIARSYAGRKTIVITQAAPEQGNVYQVEMHDEIFSRMNTIYTFSYNVDQNTLYYLEPQSQSWITENIAQGNMGNLNDAYNYGKFNDPQNWASTDDGTGDSAPVQASTPPPPLQEYDQPECPADGYLWQPGYWAYNANGGYYWVHGVWVAPPTPGYLWTPPYWGYEGGIYLFHAGYWGVSVGFYGGINYGYGYGGHGFYGGVWESGRFRYNTAVVRVNVNVVHNTYVDRTVVVNKTVNVTKNVSFNGPGGAQSKPTPEEVKVASQPHVRDHTQDPNAPKPVNNKPFNNGQRGAGQNNNMQKTQGNNGQQTPGNVNNTQRTPGSVNEPQKTPANNLPVNGQQTPGSNTNNVQKTPATPNPNAPKVPGRDGGPGVPKGPGKATGTMNGQQGNGNNPNQRRQNPQQQQGQSGNQKGGKQQPQKSNQNPPPASDKKSSNN